MRKLLTAFAALILAGAVAHAQTAPNLIPGSTAILNGTANGVLYTDSNGRLGNLATASSGFLVTDGYGVPSITSTLPAINASAALVTATGSTTARSLAERFAAQFNVKDYGAVCNGSTDDATAINAAATAAGTAGGGQVVLPAGATCKYGTAITLPSNVYLVGSGNNSSILSAAVTNINGVNLNGSYTGVIGVGIACGGAGANSSGNCINIADGVSEIFISNFRITTPFNGIRTGTGVLITIENGYIYGPTVSTGNGIVIAGGNDQNISNVFCEGQAVGSQPRSCLDVLSTQALHIYNFNSLWGGNGAIYEPGTGQTVTWVWDTGSAYDTGSQNGIVIAPTGTGVVKGYYCIGCWTATNTLDGVVVSPTGGSSTAADIHFISHRSFNNQKRGIIFQDTTTNAVVEGGSFCGNSGAGSNTYSGIVVGNVTGATITGAISGNCAGFSAIQKYGVEFTSSSADNVVITGNQLTGNVSGAYSLAMSLSQTKIATNNIGASDAAATITGTQTLTNKTISGSSNTITNIGNSSLTNSSTTVNGTTCTLGSTCTVTAAAGTLTGTTLNSTVVTSSLTSVGTLTGTTNGGSFSASSKLIVNANDTNTDSLSITNIGANGPNFKLVDNSGIAKTIRNASGSLQVMNNAYNTVLFQISDAGAVLTTGALTYAGVTFNNTVTGSGNLVGSVSPTFTGTVGAADLTATGTVRANTGFSANGTAGASATVTVRNSAGSGTCNLVFTSGLYTSTTC